MAGDWIPMRVDLGDDPAVIAIASAVGLDQFSVVGRLHRLWSWASMQLADGIAKGVSVDWVDRHVSAPGFAAAMLEAGWLQARSGHILIPNFDSWMSQSGKARLLASQRKRRERVASVSRSKRDRNETTVENNRRETEQEKEEKTPRPRIAFVPPTVDEVKAFNEQRGNSIDAEQFVAYYAARGWRTKTGPVKDWKACVVTWEGRRKQEPEKQRELELSYEERLERAKR